ncbi:uncharacterized protein LOC128404297 [Podarcis raffonei]|uniref:uncharacterized protein LOC128404297 n=1 Tax=Podarcis raffonei TaxID=65483 RepID=UPI0023295D94|nr:uncharacterized protein LOC128404297 [Podarcis raffonei]
MSSFLFLLALFIYCSGVTCQSICTQPASESVAPGQTIKLSCTTSDTGYYVGWYQQRSGQAPCFVQREGGSRGEGIPDRFTASRSGNIGYLTITNVQAGDEAIYYCCRWYSSASSTVMQTDGDPLPTAGGGGVAGFTPPIRARRLAPIPRVICGFLGRVIPGPANRLAPGVWLASFKAKRSEEVSSRSSNCSGELTIMSSFLFLLALFIYCSGVISQSICTQPASESVVLSQTIKLSCTTSNTDSYVRWYQQRSGQAPRFVQYEGSSRGEGIPDRFTASRSGTIGYLTITNVQAEDEADYHCGRWYGDTFHSDAT